MIKMRTSEAAHASHGEWSGKDVAFQGVAIDSRAVREGMLFAALPGERVDGHDFIAAAEDAGAAAVLVSRDVTCSVPVIRVDDVMVALGLLARAWRDALDPTVIGITGSNGKTTTKEMIRSILQRSHAVLATRGNYNNELGLPLTLFELEQEHAFAILEMGAARAGDIEYLAGIGQPDIGLITNVGPAHLEGFGDEDGVAAAKGEMYEALPEDGWAVMNADQRWMGQWRARCPARNVLTFGHAPDSDIHLEQTNGKCTVRTPRGSFDLQLKLPGAHNLENALAATAVALAAGSDLEQIKAGLESVSPVAGRLNMEQAPGGWKVIDDTYNANPASLYAALQVLKSEGGDRWLVLGDMAELGEFSRKLHAEMGDAARSLGVSHLYAVGEFSRASVDAFGPGARHFPDITSLLNRLLADLSPEVTCLVKGSRSMGMERVVEAISRSEATREAG